MPNDGKPQVTRTLEDLCRQATVELDSKKLNLLIEEIDHLLDEQHKAGKTRRLNNTAGLAFPDPYDG